MFDPERDEDRAARRFYVRLLTVVLVAVAGCAALVPSVIGFSAGDDNATTCLAIKDGWHADRPGPSAAAISKIDSVMPAPLSQQELHDPAAIARFRAQWHAAQADPDVQREFAREDWLAGPGACVHQSRHRLMLSGAGLGALVAVVGGAAVVRHHRGRHDDDSSSEDADELPIPSVA